MRLLIAIAVVVSLLTSIAVVDCTQVDSVPVTATADLTATEARRSWQATHEAIQATKSVAVAPGITATAEVKATRLARDASIAADRAAVLGASWTATAESSWQHAQRRATVEAHGATDVRTLKDCVADMESVVKPSLVAPRSMKVHDVVYFSEPNAGGYYRWRMEFSAVSVFGARFDHTAYGTVNPGADPPSTCDARFGYIDG